MSRVSTRRASKRNSAETTENDAELTSLPPLTPKRRKQQIPEEATDMFENISWDRLYEEFIQHKKDKLEALVLRIFLQFAENTIDKKVMGKLIHDIAQQYNGNKYHNFEHGSHVLLNAAYLLTRIKDSFLAPIEKLSFLYAALIHDVDHYGIPNSTLIQNRHPLAILFHDQSVAENHSLTIGLNIIANLNPQPRHDCKYKQLFLDTVLQPVDAVSLRSAAQYDILAAFNEQEKHLFRHNVIELVLNTDIADPYRRKNLYDKLLVGYAGMATHHANTDSSTTTAGNEKMKAYNHDAPSNRLYFMSLLLRLADIGASTQSLPTFLCWSENFFLENYEAYEEEQRSASHPAVIDTSSQPPTPVRGGSSSSSSADSASTKKISAFFQSSSRFYKAQVGYMESHPTHLIQQVEQSQLMQEEWLQSVKEAFQSNLQHWKTNGRHVYQQWLDKHKYEALEDE